MNNFEAIKEQVETSISEMRFDVDVDFCIANDIKFDNHEIDAKELDLFDSASNLAAFKFVFGIE